VFEKTEINLVRKTLFLELLCRVNKWGVAGPVLLHTSA
jgi:hypothetical protein